MKAPDRLTIYGDGQYHPGPDTEGGGEEYVRKGAFDLVEIRARIVEMETVGEVDWAMTLNRILSLLEGEQG